MDEIVNINTEERQTEKTLYCSFVRGGKTYYIAVEHLREVIEIKDIFPIPLAPDYIKGAILLRGSVIPVIDLAVLNYIKQELQEAHTLLIFYVSRESIGFLSERLPSFISFDESIPQESIIDINRFFETYMIKETS